MGWKEAGQYKPGLGKEGREMNERGTYGAIRPSRLKRLNTGQKRQFFFKPLLLA
jgi:hypothetical protein